MIITMRAWFIPLVSYNISKIPNPLKTGKPEDINFYTLLRYFFHASANVQRLIWHPILSPSFQIKGLFE